jgi:ribonucrease Y
MEPLYALILGCLATLPFGVAGGYVVARLLDRARLKEVRNESDLILRTARAEAEHVQRDAEMAHKGADQARKEADQFRKEAEQNRRDAEQARKEAELRARDDLQKMRDNLNREAEQARAEMREQERRLDKREDSLEEKNQSLIKKERALEINQRKLSERHTEIEKRAEEVQVLVKLQAQKLHELSNLTRDQAETMLLARLERELAEVIALRLQRHEEQLRQSSEERARRILATAIHRYAAEHTADTTVSTVDIPSDDMKGRIIGREGRNIRTFEKCTGVDVIVDDTPGVVIVSAFDNVRRETARLALTRLIQDGRIHPSRIEEVVIETQAEMEKHIMEVGRLAVQDANIGPLHDKLVGLLGRLKFRTSYSQNVLQHSLEVAHLTGLMAEELGLDGRLARRCGLLHDVGKAADHEMEGGHPKIGAELAKRYGETNNDVLHAIIGHHDDVTIDHIYTVLVASADAISASRPGARRETLEKYVKRLEELEAVACGFPGVEHAYAIQAGREVRVIANAAQTTDHDAIKVCHDIARAIEEKLHYPGEIKVTVVRETRAVEIAR